MATYKAEAEARLKEREGGETNADSYERIRKLGFDFAAVSAARHPNKTDAIEKAENFLENRDANFLALFGGKGVGKSTAAAHVAIQFAKHHAWNSGVSGSNLEPIQFIRASVLTRVSAYDKNDHDLLAKLERASLLVVDDMGHEGTDSGRSTLTDLLMNRHAKNKRTVITSNLRADAFRDRYGEALVDRMRSSGFVHELRGASMRENYGVAT